MKLSKALAQKAPARSPKYNVERKPNRQSLTIYYCPPGGGKTYKLYNDINAVTHTNYTFSVHPSIDSIRDSYYDMGEKFPHITLIPICSGTMKITEDGYSDEEIEAESNLNKLATVCTRIQETMSVDNYDVRLKRHHIMMTRHAYDAINDHSFMDEAGYQGFMDEITSGISRVSVRWSKVLPEDHVLEIHGGRVLPKAILRDDAYLENIASAQRSFLKGVRSSEATYHFLSKARTKTKDAITNTSLMTHEYLRVIKPSYFTKNMRLYSADAKQLVVVDILKRHYSDSLNVKIVTIDAQHDNYKDPNVKWEFVSFIDGKNSLTKFTNNPEDYTAGMQMLLDAMGDEQFLYFGNNRINIPLPPNAKQLKNNAHGSNKYKHYANVVIQTAVNRTKTEIRCLSDYYDVPSYRFELDKIANMMNLIMRCNARVPGFKGTIRVGLPSLEDALLINSRYLGNQAEVVLLGGLAFSAVGRPPMEEKASQTANNKAAYMRRLALEGYEGYTLPEIITINSSGTGSTSTNILSQMPLWDRVSSRGKVKDSL